MNRITYCIFLIIPLEDSLNSTVILGQPFLKNFNVYYDVDNKQIGLYGKREVFKGGPYSNPGDGPNGNTGGEDSEGGTTGGGDTEGDGSTGGEGTEGIKEEAGFIIGTIKQLLGSLTQLGLFGILFMASLILNLILLYFCCCFFLYRRDKDEKDDKEEPLLQPRGDSV